MIKKMALFLMFCLFQCSAFSNTQNKADHIEQLQRGARLYMNYCSGCHSLHYLRYNQMAEGLGIMNAKGQPDEALMQKNLIFTQASLYDPVLIAMPENDAKRWFGVVPPDLSLITRIRGEQWLYDYLNSFYQDNSRPFGVNNLMYPDVAMPAVLGHLSGKKTFINHQSQPPGLVLVEQGEMTQSEFTQALQDLVAFLAYVGDPNKMQRYQTGSKVILYLIILFLVALGYFQVLKIKKINRI